MKITEKGMLFCLYSQKHYVGKYSQVTEKASKHKKNN